MHLEKHKRVVSHAKMCENLYVTLVVGR